RIRSPRSAISCLAELAGYLAPDGFLAELQHELGEDALETHGRLVLARRAPRDVAGFANLWREPVRLTVTSIGDAAKQLRAIQRNWAPYSFAHPRRAALVAAKLPTVSAKPLTFG